MKIKIIKLITFLMVGAGIILLAYPAVSNWLISRNQTAAIKNYGLTVDEMNEQKKQRELKKAREYNGLLNGIGIVDPFVPDSGYVLPEEYLSVLNINGVIGYIDIPKINVNLPIYHGTEEDTLKKGAGHLRNTAFPIGGEGNHTVLTGHRGLTSAKLFTDLDKLKTGDMFYINVLNDRLAYKIDLIQTVEPNDTKELVPVKGKDYVTLITCTPYGINSHRLFIRAERVDCAQSGGEIRLLNGAAVFCLLLIVSLLIVLRLAFGFIRRKTT